MKERPILFSAPMVMAILAGTKTQTRRKVYNRRTTDYQSIEERDDGTLWPWRETEDAQDYWYRCPYGQPSDRLWVRETWNFFNPDEIPADRRGARAPFTGARGKETIPWVAAYFADGALEHQHFGRALWRPSIHMPRWASRINLEVVGVRVERLQDISEQDAWAEGCTPGAKNDIGGFFPAEEPDKSGVGMVGWDCARDWYADLWESINGPGSWSANPWVWVVEFKRVAV